LLARPVKVDKHDMHMSPHTAKPSWCHIARDNIRIERAHPRRITYVNGPQILAVRLPSDVASPSLFPLCVRYCRSILTQRTE
jgi:hypothetical protein